MLETDGRSRLCRRYIRNVGPDRNKEPDDLPPIRQLIEDVATRILLRYAEPEDTSSS